MRTLINGVSAVAGGGVTYLRNLLAWLPQRAPDDDFVFAVAPGLDLPRPVSPRIQIREIPQARLGIFQRWVWENTGLFDLCRSEQADLLFCPANLTPWRPAPVPMVLMVRNVAPFYPRVRRGLFRDEGVKKAAQMLLLEVLSRVSLRRADHVLYLSQATRTLIEQKVGPIPGTVLYHGIDHRFSPNIGKPAGCPDSPFFLYVSNIYLYKGYEYIIEALAQNPDLPPVLAVGQVFDAGYNARIQQMSKDQGVDKRLRFIGKIPNHELPGWYAQAQALVYPSWCENCPNILIEAMACGCPVVAVKTGPMPEICGPAAWYAEPFQTASLAQAMRNAANAPDRATWQARARTRAEQFHWERSIDTLLNALRQTLSNRAS